MSPCAPGPSPCRPPLAFSPAAWHGDGAVAARAAETDGARAADGAGAENAGWLAGPTGTALSGVTLAQLDSRATAATSPAAIRLMSFVTVVPAPRLRQPAR